MPDRWWERWEPEDPDDRDAEPEFEPRRRDRKHRRRRGRSQPLGAEERALRAARRRANARIGFHAHALTFLGVLFIVLFFVGARPAMILGLCWGIGLASHYFGAVVAPDVRRRYIDREVRREVRHSAPRERRDIEGKHVRSLEELSASIAHEIRNPITAAKSLVQQMGEDPASHENVEYAKVALDELDRVERSVAHLLRYAREEELRMAEVNVAEVIQSALATFDERATSAGVAITTDFDTHVVVRADADKLRRVMINLIGNALDACEGAGVRAPAIEVAMGENLAGTECWVRVRDNGPGIDEEMLEEVFSPFYTSKQTGTGLGLALSKKVLDAHGGAIEACAAPGGGAEFTLTMPRQALRG
jgi:signal transduction histidine kinase